MYQTNSERQYWVERKRLSEREIVWMQNRIAHLAKKAEKKPSAITEIDHLIRRIRENEIRIAFYTQDYRDARMNKFLVLYEKDPQELVRQRIKLYQEEL